MSPYLDILRLLAPEAILVFTALLVMLADLTVLREKTLTLRRTAAGALVVIGCLAAMTWLQLSAGGTSGFLVLTSTAQLLKQALLILTAFTAVLSCDGKFTRHIGEYFAMLLFAATGLMLLVSSDHLLVIFVALELVGLSLYALTAFNKQSAAGAEAALKYFLFGGMAAAFTLFGISLLYGLTGELGLGAIARNLAAGPTEPVLWVAMIMTLVGFAFKLAAAPFHLWAPDTYQGAPTPVASFIASGSKVASFYVFARIVMEGLAAPHGSAALGKFSAGWMPIVAILAVASMVIGNLIAIVQTSVKRLLAYSAVAHGGYALLALLGNQRMALPSLFFYVITYAFTVLGAFAVVSVVEEGTGRDDLVNFAGLSRRAPLVSACMLVFLLSLAGIPPLSGFFGKFNVFTAAAAGSDNLGQLWLVIVAVAASAVSLYYYLQVLKQIYAGEAPAQAGLLRLSPSTRMAIASLAVAVIVLGCAPDLLLSKLTLALQSTPF